MKFIGFIGHEPILTETSMSQSERLRKICPYWIWGRKSITEEVAQKDLSEDKAVSSIFFTQTQNLLHFHSPLLKPDRELFRDFHTPNANMADHSVVARDELHESEVSQSSMFCFESASPGNSCFVVALFCFISLCLRVPVFLYATRRDRNLPPFSSKGK